MICSVIVNDQVTAKRNESLKENPIKTRNAFRYLNETSWKKIWKKTLTISWNSYGGINTECTQLLNLSNLSIFILKTVTRKK